MKFLVLAALLAVSQVMPAAAQSRIQNFIDSPLSSNDADVILAFYRTDWGHVTDTCLRYPIVFEKSAESKEEAGVLTKADLFNITFCQTLFNTATQSILTISEALDEGILCPPSEAQVLEDIKDIFVNPNPRAEDSWPVQVVIPVALTQKYKCR